MNKCSQCNSCVKHVWVQNKHYLYCTLCRIVYASEAGSSYVQVVDPEIINAVRSMFGDVVT